MAVEVAQKLKTVTCASAKTRREAELVKSWNAEVVFTFHSAGMSRCVCQESLLGMRWCWEWGVTGNAPYGTGWVLLKTDQIERDGVLLECY